MVKISPSCALCGIPDISADNRITDLRAHRPLLLPSSKSLGLLADHSRHYLHHPRHRRIHNPTHWWWYGRSWCQSRIAEQGPQLIHGRHRYAGRLYHSLLGPGRQVPSRPAPCCKDRTLSRGQDCWLALDAMGTLHLHARHYHPHRLPARRVFGGTRHQ